MDGPSASLATSPVPSLPLPREPFRSLSLSSPTLIPPSLPDTPPSHEDACVFGFTVPQSSNAITSSYLHEVPFASSSSGNAFNEQNNKANELPSDPALLSADPTFSLTSLPSPLLPKASSVESQRSVLPDPRRSGISLPPRDPNWESGCFEHGPAFGSTPIEPCNEMNMSFAERSLATNYSYPVTTHSQLSPSHGPFTARPTSLATPPAEFDDIIWTGGNTQHTSEPTPPIGEHPVFQDSSQPAPASSSGQESSMLLTSPDGDEDPWPDCVMPSIRELPFHSALICQVPQQRY